MRNGDGEACCTTCYTVRPGLQALKCTWEWKAADRWIPFDLPAARQIETAFAEQAKEASLTAGWFGEQRATYVVRFYARGPNRHAQVNLSTRNVREVRRVSEDDDALFVPVGEAEVARDEDVCVVCQYPLVGRGGDGSEDGDEVGDGEEAASARPVRLVSCKPGHAMHRECLSSWFRLKGTCPYCKSAPE